MRHIHRLAKLCATVTLGLAAAATAHAQALPDGWVEYAPGGDTICARGAPFSFFVREGASDKVIVDFIGGGACWDASTCDTATAIFTDSVDDLRRAAQQHLPGVYDHNRADNPYKDWTHVVIPYCTGDVHWGDSDVTYTRRDGTQFVIHHRGARNVHAVLDWVKEHVSAPKDVLVTGCSAGSYGSIFYTPAVKEMFPGARVAQFGDSGVGILTKSFQEESFPRWNVVGSAPTWIPGLDPATTDYTKIKLSDFYARAAQYYPDVQFAQYNTDHDFIQTFFYLQMGGDADLWSQAMRTSLADIHAAAPNFHSFVGPGDKHCATVVDDFYEIRSNGVGLRDWVGGLIGGTPQADVDCGSACERNGL